MFTKKEVKSIEEKLNLKFFSISYGHVTNTGFFQSGNCLNSDFNPVSISAKRTESGWEFMIYQSGFRGELLPNKYEKEIKRRTKIEIITYINKISNSLETDFHNYPQLWVHSKIVNEQPFIEVKEIK